jgi:gamma-tubulin complex component 3
VPQAVCHALQAELDEWYQLIAVLDAQRQAELSLVQLLVWSHEPLLRLTTLVTLVRATGKLKGGAMTVAMQRQARHGDPAVAGYATHILRKACTPLFGMLARWVLVGELHDPHSEFFVERRAAVPAELRTPAPQRLEPARRRCCVPPRRCVHLPTAEPEIEGDGGAAPGCRCYAVLCYAMLCYAMLCSVQVPLERMWAEGFALREAMLPCFVPKPLALAVLGVGKTLNFIRLACRDTVRADACLAGTRTASS